MCRETIEQPSAQIIAGDCWREAPNGQVELLAARCCACGTHHLPHVPVCATCNGEEFENAVLGPHGTLYAYTIVRMPPPGYAGEYAVGYVDFPEGVRVFGQIKIVPGVALGSGVPVGLEKAALFKRADGTPVIAYRFVPATKGGSQ